MGKIPCPVCGSKNIEEVMDSNDIAGPGFQNWVEYEYCKNCGVLLYHGRKPLKVRKKSCQKRLIQ